MSVKVPVYSDSFGYHQINVWVQVEGGTFRRTARFAASAMLDSSSQ